MSVNRVNGTSRGNRPQPGKGANGSDPRHLPTPGEIEAAAEEIRAGWSDHEHRQRNGSLPDRPAARHRRRPAPEETSLSNVRPVDKETSDKVFAMLDAACRGLPNPHPEFGEVVMVDPEGIDLGGTEGGAE